MKTVLALSFLALSFTLSACSSGEIDDPAALDALDGGKEDALRAGRFETFTGRDGKTYFHLIAGNGQKVLQSQGYASARNAADGIATVRFNGADADAYQLLQAENGQWYFNLLAGNWQTIATSELYVSKSNAERAVSTAVALLPKTTQQGAAATDDPRFQVFRGFDGKYYFHVRAANGEIVLQSQGYTRRASALDGTASVRANGGDTARYELRDAANGQSYFVLGAANGQVIGTSETYASRSNAARGLAGVAGLFAAPSAVADAQ